ncbi:MAG: ATP-binding protein [Thermodesulfobacteriota bacterium]
MRTRLSFEIFGAFLLASLVLVILTIGGLRYFSYVGFRDYVHKKELQRLPYMGLLLEREHAKGQGWDRLRGDPDAWHALVDAARELERADDGDVEEDDAPEDGEPAGQRKKRERNRPQPWLFLLDENRQLLAGHRGEEGPENLIKLNVDGETVGWLGLSMRPLKWSPLEVAFLEQQYRMFYFLGGGVFLLAVVLTVLLSRRFLVPIQKLMEGTQALASRRFDVRIRVQSRNELGRLADDFNRMAETLESYETMRRQWISDISHELRTPLSILQGELLALQDGVRPLTPEAVDSLQGEVDRLAKLVEALHLLSLADSEGLAIRRDRIEPARILRRRVEAFREPMNRAGIAVRLDAQGAESAAVTGDEEQLGRVFSNLLQNTLQYTDAPGTLDIRALRRGDSLEITFEDSAPGVPDEALGRLFDRLFRVEKSRSRALGGSGLGLSIARRIAEAHGGGISANRAGTGGLRMTVTLPLRTGNH